MNAKDGAGALDALAAVEIAQSRQTPNNIAAERGWDAGTLKPTDFDSNTRSRTYTLSRFDYRVKVPASGARHVKVALAWNSRTTFNKNFLRPKATSELVHDFDVFIYEGGRLVAESASVDNSYEIAEFDAKAGKSLTIHISRQPGTANEDVYYGIAWMVHPRA